MYSNPNSNEIQANPATSPAFRRRITNFRLFIVGFTLGCAAFLGVLGTGYFPALSGTMPWLFDLVAAYLVGMAVFGWFLFSRTLTRLPTRVALADDGVKFQLGNGQVLTQSWTDPTFAMDITEPTPGSPGEQFIQLTWRTTSSQRWVNITTTGFDLLQTEALRYGLRKETLQQGQPPRTWTLTKIRP